MFVLFFLKIVLIHCEIYYLYIKYLLNTFLSSQVTYLINIKILVLTIQIKIKSESF